MRPASYLLAISLVANVALIGVLLLRAPLNRTLASTSASPENKIPAAPNAAQERLALQAALASGDAAALAAAGLPPEAVRAFIVGRAFDRYQTAARAKYAKQRDGKKYWQPDQQEPASSHTEHLLFREAERQLMAAFHQAYGYDFETLVSGKVSAYDFLPPAKREKLRQIEYDYRDLKDQIEANFIDGVALPADLEKLELLDREKERDLAAALNPDESRQLALRTSAYSSAAYDIQQKYGSVIETEEEYKRFLALEEAHRSRLAALSANAESEAASKARREAVIKQREEIHALLGPDRIETLRRVHDSDRHAVSAIATRLGLPPEAADTVVQLRERYAAHSQQIDTTAILAPEERATRFKILLASAEADLRLVLGSDGASAYLTRAVWLSHLKSAQAFSTNPRAASPEDDIIVNHVFPVGAPSLAPAGRP